MFLMRVVCVVDCGDGLVVVFDECGFFFGCDYGFDCEYEIGFYVFVVVWSLIVEDVGCFVYFEVDVVVDVFVEDVVGFVGDG